MKRAVIGSEIKPFLQSPKEVDVDPYYEKYLRIEAESFLDPIPDFFSSDGDFYDLDKKLNINIANVDDNVFQKLFSFKLLELNEKNIKLAQFLNFQLLDNFYGNRWKIRSE